MEFEVRGGGGGGGGEGRGYVAEPIGVCVGGEGRGGGNVLGREAYVCGPRRWQRVCGWVWGGGGGGREAAACQRRPMQHTGLGGGGGESVSTNNPNNPEPQRVVVGVGCGLFTRVTCVRQCGVCVCVLGGEGGSNAGSGSEAEGKGHQATDGDGWWRRRRATGGPSWLGPPGGKAPTEGPRGIGGGAGGFAGTALAHCGIAVLAWGAPSPAHAALGRKRPSHRPLAVGLTTHNRTTLCIIRYLNARPCTLAQVARCRPKFTPAFFKQLDSLVGAERFSAKPDQVRERSVGGRGWMGL